MGDRDQKVKLQTSNSKYSKSNKAYENVNRHEYEKENSMREKQLSKVQTT